MTNDTEKSTSTDNTAVAMAVALLGFALAMSGALEKILKALEPHTATIIEAAENYPAAKQIEDAGWLPHPTFPIHLLETHKDDVTTLNRAITQYYKDTWEKARAAFDEQLEQRRIDNKAKALFRQAFTAHEMELYAIVPRAVFPELERIARQKFGETPLTTATSQRRLKIALEERLSLADASPRGIYGFNLLGKFLDHVYKHVDDDYLPVAKKDPVPNRHAALHGYFVYDTAQSSLNALIMADYILHLFDALDASVSDESNS